MTRPSPFFNGSSVASADSLAILHLRRDALLPITLRTTADDGYAEGAVTNTRFGSYPHSTLIGATWGTQIRASKVDTGTRGRKGKHAVKNAANPAFLQPTPPSHDSGNKRKASEITADESLAKRQKQDLLTPVAANTRSAGPPLEAGSGFTHILPPTPETWTASLDHRTQVVYVPDYSYILSRLRVKPGEVIIEAGAGSGSFTHAAARAVFNGYPTSASDETLGRVYSFEYHEPRVQTLKEELYEHSLDSIVTLTHRDVCGDGFSVAGTSPRVTAIFLDLPAPWLALQHLTRRVTNSPLSKHAPVRICTFSPCIEQVTATVSALRAAGWVEIQMVEVQNRRLEVRRERVGLHEEGLRGVNAVAASVEESLARLREVESKLKDFHNASRLTGDSTTAESERAATPTTQSKAERLQQIKKDAESRPLYKEGRLTYKTENDIKTHTSYLVFAILPQEWTNEDELASKVQWSKKEDER